jgi:hypothetical protein
VVAVEVADSVVAEAALAALVAEVPVAVEPQADGRLNLCRFFKNIKST